MERNWFDEEWKGFKPGRWSSTSVNLRDFIQKNFTPYEGDESFLAGPTEATKQLWDQVLELSKKEREAGGVLDMDTKIVSTITSHDAGYLNKDLEKIVGFQTDKPFKRSLQPFGGLRMAQQACKQYGYEVDPEIVKIFTEYRKTHNQGVFDAYTPEMKLARHAAILTGLPDAYGRGRIIGDYRRVALYGVDYLIEDKKDQLANSLVRMTSKNIRLREELAEQIRALGELKKLGEIYGCDISKPAKNAQEAIQWLYFGYLAAVKEQNGAAMSLGRTSTFIDIYIQRDVEGERVVEGYVVGSDNNESGVLVKETFDQSTDSEAQGAASYPTPDDFNTYNLKLTKMVTGTMGDRHNQFPFAITVSDSGRAYYADKGAAPSSTTTLNQTAHTTALQTTLAHEEIYYIAGLRNNDTVAYTETNNTNETYNVTVTGESTATSVAPNGSHAMSSKTAPNATDITFTNSHNSVSPTGVVMRFGPYIGMVLIAGLLIMLRKRTKTNR